MQFENFLRDLVWNLLGIARLFSVYIECNVADAENRELFRAVIAEK